MLQLKNIIKDYKLGDGSVQQALKGISINFRQNEFVSILGPSGCGKTTTLNIVGGLDHYTSGDLIINNKSTKNFKDKDWDDYRNKSIGFVFQSYNLIPHQNVVNNVAMGLTLAGVKKAERIRLAKAALEKVGLGNSLKKKPNQLSGGQMQRVAIARALVGNPDIILADEPTGALDSETGVQVMEILKQVAKDKLVIMVTHNAELAQQYSTRIISILDGKLVDDTNPYSDEALKKDQAKQTAPVVQDNVKKKKVAMSLGTAFALSGKTLREKKGRTFITALAGSIGIFAITLILAISAGMNDYIANVQKTALSNSAITISETAYDIDGMMTVEQVNLPEYPRDATGIYPRIGDAQKFITNNITDEFVTYVKNLDPNLVTTVKYNYATKMNIITQNGAGYKLLTTESSSNIASALAPTGWYDVSSQVLAKQNLITENYDVLYKAQTSENGLPSNKNELTLVVDKYNRISTATLDALGIDYTTDLAELSYESLTQKVFKLVPNNTFYSHNGVKYVKPTEDDQDALAEKYNDATAETLQIVGIVRVKSDDAITWLPQGIIYSSELTDYVLTDAKNSEVGQAQINDHDKNVITNMPFTSMNMAGRNKEEQYQDALKSLGIVKVPTNISIYPADINTKDEIIAYLDAWNDEHADNKITYQDLSQMLISMLGEMIDIVSYVLIGFCAISLVVSTVMISVTTYTSVVERTKEIGVLRSLGARKKDISRIFNAETIMIGGLAGLLGVVLAGLVGTIANAALFNLVHTNIVNSKFLTGLLMVALSTFLTWIAGLVPARIAAKKDPVLCLRTE